MDGQAVAPLKYRCGQETKRNIENKRKGPAGFAQSTRSTVKICKTAGYTPASATLPPPFRRPLFSPAYSGPSIISPPPPSQGSMNGYGPQVNSANGQTTVNFVSFDLPNSKPWLRLVSVSRARRPALIFHRCIDWFTHQIKGSNYNTIIELFLFLLSQDTVLLYIE